MIRELRQLDIIDPKKSARIRILQSRGKIKKILNKEGYVCYDTEELENYKGHKGRPPKTK